MVDTLLKTKLYIPPTRPALVSRPRLLKRLNNGLHRKFTLISAPPGFGKTTLLSEWIHQNNEIEMMNGESPTENIHHSSFTIHPSKIAWVSLDEQDNDPTRFWSYLFAAIDSVQPDIATDAKTLLLSPQAPPIETTLTTLINAIVTIPDKLILILDDYHLIENESIHQAFSFLLEHLPPQMHIAITSRTDPTFPLTRLRVQSQLTELRNSDLRFTTEEALAFLNNVMGLDLSADDVAALEKRTEGWVAGLQLAALSMQGHHDTPSFVREFTGSHRYVIDYLAEEVLTRQPQPVRTFLLRTSILERLCGPLCDALMEVVAKGANGQSALPLNDSQSMLEHLEQANLFLIPLDGERRWYRYHHLFADFLQGHLQQEIDEQEVINLHRRASHWFAVKGFTAEAIRHAFLACDIEYAADLMEQVIINLLTSGEVSTAMGWLDTLPADVIRARPRLALGQAWSMVILNRWSNVEPLVDAAEARLLKMEAGGDAELARIQGMQGEIAALRAMMIGDSGDIDLAVQLCHQALEQLPKDNLIVRSIITMTLGGVYSRAQDWNKATQTITEALTLSKSIDAVTVALPTYGNLGNIQEETGQLHRAANYYREAIDFVEQRAAARGQPGKPLLISGWSYLSLAEILREWNELEKAEAKATFGLEMSQQLEGTANTSPTIAQLIMSRIRQAQGDTAGALQFIQQAEQSVDHESLLRLWVQAVQARLWLMQGNVVAAAQWAHHSNLSPQDDSFIRLPGEYTTLVRVMIAQEQFDDAQQLLARMRAEFETTGRIGRLVEVIMLQALATHAQGETEQALELLSQSIDLAEPGGYVRLFVDEGPPMAKLIQSLKTQAVPARRAYLEKLLAAFSGDHQQAPSASAAQGQAALIDPLSERELEVLNLVADGLSNREIAEQLFITVGTAKTHTINIYRKLDVRSRTQAVAKATELGLL